MFRFVHKHEILTSSILYIFSMSMRLCGWLVWYVCVCVCACVRACVHVCVSVTILSVI